jgi:hypothetical protein
MDEREQLRPVDYLVRCLQDVIAKVPVRDLDEAWTAYEAELRDRINAEYRV